MQSENSDSSEIKSFENRNPEEVEADRNNNSDKYLDSKLSDYQDDYLYNLKRLAEITLAYFNNEDNNSRVRRVTIRN